MQHGYRYRLCAPRILLDQAFPRRFTAEYLFEYTIDSWNHILRLHTPAHVLVRPSRTGSIEGGGAVSSEECKMLPQVGGRGRCWVTGIPNKSEMS